MIKFLLLVIIGVNAIYEHQAGLHDWAYKLYGELQDVWFGSVIHFQTATSLGAINKQSGQITYKEDNDYTRCIDTDERLRFVKYDSDQQRIVLYFLKEDFHRIIEDIQISGYIEGCFAFSDDSFIIIDQNDVHHITTGGKKQKKALNWSFLTGFFFKDAGAMLIQKDNRVCVAQVTESDMIYANPKLCEKFDSNKIEVRVLKDGFLVWEEKDARFIKWDERDVRQITDKNTYAIPIEHVLNHRTILSQSNSIINEKYQLLRLTENDVEHQHDFNRNSVFVNDVQGQQNDNHVYYVRFEENRVFFNLYDLETKKDLAFGDVYVNTQSRVSHVYLKVQDYKNKYFLVQHEDLYTYLYSSSDNSLVWESEQGLQYVDAVLWEKIADERDHRNSYFESLAQNGPRNPLYLAPNLVLRFQNDLSDLVQWAQSVPKRVTKFVNQLNQLRLSGANSGEDQRQESKEYDITYGLRQHLIIVTQMKTFMCFDSEDGKLLWRDSSLLGRMDSSYKLKGYHKIELKNVHRDQKDEQVPLHYVLVYYSQQKQRLNIFVLDPVTRDIQQVASQPSSLVTHVQSYRVKHDKSPYENLILIINEDKEIITYPRIPIENAGLGSNQVLLYLVESEFINGYTFTGKQLIQIWSYKVGSSEEIIKIRSSYFKGEENHRVAIWDDNRVLFKVIDYSNFALLTRDSETQTLVLSILNSKTGKLLFQSVQKNVQFDLPINLAFDENSVFVTYFNAQNQIYEIWTVEIFHQRIEVSFLKMLEDYYFKEKEETHLNYYESDIKAVFLQQVYGYPLGIKQLSITKTRQQLTKKNLLIITPENQIHSLDRNLVSSRRRKQTGQQAPNIPDDSFESFELFPYQYLLPINYQAVLSYNLQLNGLNNFYLQPTNLESTSLLLVTGSDVFFTRISPDRTYDMIQTDFNYTLLLLTVIIMIGLTNFVRNLSKKSKVIKIFYSG